jgi:hypothetical protein
MIATSQAASTPPHPNLLPARGEKERVSASCYFSHVPHPTQPWHIHGVTALTRSRDGLDYGGSEGSAGRR